MSSTGRRRGWLAPGALAIATVATMLLVTLPLGRWPPTPAASRDVTLALLPIEFADNDAAERAYWNGLTASVWTASWRAAGHRAAARDAGQRGDGTAGSKHGGRARRVRCPSHVVRGVATAQRDQLLARLDLVDTAWDSSA